MVSILSWIVQSSSYSGWNELGCSHASTTAEARSAAPTPPLAKPSLASAPNAPASSASRLTSSTSSFVSPGRRLTATTAGRPNCLVICRWRRTFAIPVSIADRPCWRSTRGSSAMPPWCLMDRTGVRGVVAGGGGHHDPPRAPPPPPEPAKDKKNLPPPHVRAEAGLGHDVV